MIKLKCLFLFFGLNSKVKAYFLLRNIQRANIGKKILKI